MHNIWVSRTSTTILILKRQIVLAGENRMGDWQFWILRGFLNYWEILGCVKQADWASLHLLFLIIFTLLEFPCCAKSCPGESLLPRSNLFAWGNWGRVILTCKRRGHMLHANERATAQSKQIFPLPRAFLLLLYRISWGFRVSHTFPLGSLTPAAHPAPGGSCGEAAQAPWGAVQGRPCHWSCAGRSGCWRCKGWATLSSGSLPQPGGFQGPASGRAGPKPPSWAASLGVCCSQVLPLENWLLCAGSNFLMLFNTHYCIPIVKGPRPVLIQDLDTGSLWCYKHHF